MLRCAIFLALCSLSFAQTIPRPCPDFPIKTSDGKTIRISKYHGKVVMIVMMKTDCSPCHQMLETVSQWQKEWQPRGFQVLAFVIDDTDTNVAGAINAGLHGYKFVSAEALAEELASRQLL